MADGIEVHYNPDYGQLFLKCESDAFARLSDLLIAESGAADEVVNGQLASVQLIDHSAVSQATPTWIRDRLALLGCSLAGLVIMFPFVIGVMTIIGWFL